MQKKYPENTAEIENFYQKHLEGIQIEPPAAVWDRIESAMDKDRKPKGLISPAKKITAISLALILICFVTYLLIQENNPSSIQKEIPAINDSAHKTQDNILNKKTEQTEKKKEDRITEKPVNPKTERPSDNKKESETSKDLPEDQDKSIDLEKYPIATDSTSTESSEKGPLPEEEVKVKESFKDKYKKKYQDSTRPLFVPEE